jgi:Flavoprotein
MIQPSHLSTDDQEAKVCCATRLTTTRVERTCLAAKSSIGAIIMEPTLSSLSGRNVLLGVTGSVAAVKAPALVRQWQADGAHVQVLLTQGGRHFWDRAAAYENGNDTCDDCGPGWLPPDVQFHGEWTVWTQRNDGQGIRCCGVSSLQTHFCP